MRNGVTGPHLKRLQAALDRFVPEGSTPTSATLNSLLERLIASPGNTTVILATDGAPNCNENAVCDVNHCSPNLERAPLPGGGSCDASVNCCGPGYYGPIFCIDVDATLVPLARLLEHGIKTYVIGLPGSEVFADVLERMAVAGGTARTDALGLDVTVAAGGAGQKATDVSVASAGAGNPAIGFAGAANIGSARSIAPGYYSVTDAAQLTTALRKITATLSIGCTITLDVAPPDWSLVNVYFDNAIVKMSPGDGWKQVDEKALEITGALCELLRSGDVFQVQIVAGCPTEVLI